MKTYIFKIELEEEEGIWTAVVPFLPGCNAWGKTKEEAILAIQENTKAYLETLLDNNLPIPVEKEEITTPLNAPAVAVVI